MNSAKKIVYISYYSDPSPNSLRKTAPAADTKIDYISDAIKEAGYDLVLLSAAGIDKRDRFITFSKGYQILKNGKCVKFFSTLSSRFVIFRVFGRMLLILELFKEILHEKKKDKSCKLLIYHSLGFDILVRILALRRIEYALELEELYSDVIRKKTDKARRIEKRIINQAKSFILSTALLEKSIDIRKPFIICNGTYRVEQVRNNTGYDSEIIHCVYAGTFDPRKGAAAAASAAEYLTSNYHVHILGFGSDEDTVSIKKTIERVTRKSAAKVSFDGLKTGNDYIDFIQSCQIGLSTQDPEAVFNSTSFPSKVLSYLANGLRVVSIRIPSIEQSAVGSIISYFDNQTPKEIANAIMNVDMTKPYDSRKLIDQLNREFISSLESIF